MTRNEADSDAPLGNPKQAEAGEDFDPGRSNLQKAPEEWVTGDERMTDAQASYLKTLCEEAGIDFEPGLTKAEASERIDELKRITGRGTPGRAPSDGD